MHVYDQSDRCWAALVIEFNAYWAALPTLLVGTIDYWQDAIVKCERHGITGSVTEVQSHDKGGRSVTGGKTSGHGIITGAWLHSLLECMVYYWAWEYNYKLNYQPIHERVTASNIIVRLTVYKKLACVQPLWLVLGSLKGTQNSHMQYLTGHGSGANSHHISSYQVRESMICFQKLSCYWMSC